MSGRRAQARLQSVALVLLVLAGCGGDIQGSKQLAIHECLRKSLELQGYRFAGSQQEEQEGDRLFAYALLAGPMDVSPFKLKMDPDFFDVNFGDVKMPWPKKAYRLACSGNFPARTLTSVDVNGRVYRPAAGETWAFADAEEPDAEVREGTAQP